VPLCVRIAKNGQSPPAFIPWRLHPSARRR